jgi:tRNA-dihydrouridine synthase B
METTETTHQPTFWVGDIPIYGDLILAPMDGVTDMPFRAMARELGSAMSYTGFVSAIEILAGTAHAGTALAYEEAERPVVFQLFDDDPEHLLRAALKARELNPDIIDINMGCSAKTVTGRGAGAGLLCEPRKIERIFSSISKALDIPLTGKIRLGWDEASLNYLEIAHIIEENGGRLIAVHGRTKRQGYTGRADWDAIARVKAAAHVPVIGNGDVRSVADIAAIQAQTGVDAVMIGRGAMENPWLFQRLDRGQVPGETVYRTLADHLSRSQRFYGAERGLVLFRKFASRYVLPYAVDRQTRERLLTSADPDEFLAIAREVIERAVPVGEVG